MTNDLHILLADDDKELCSLLSEFLESEGFSITQAHDGEQALNMARQQVCDLMVLDMMMPKMNGMEVLKLLRQDSSLPVIMLTARGEPIDRIIGLEVGADDYIPKPCNPRELVARIRAVLRRLLAWNNIEKIVHVDDIKLMPSMRTVEKQGKPIVFTSTEFTLLSVLLTHAGEVVSKELLSEQSLGRRLAVHDRSIDMHVSKIRKKLGNLTDGSERIKTIRGAGYLYVRLTS